MTDPVVVGRITDVELVCRSCGAQRLVPGGWDEPAMAAWAASHRAPQVEAYLLTSPSAGVRAQRVEVPVAPGVLRR